MPIFSSSSFFCSATSEAPALFGGVSPVEKGVEPDVLDAGARGQFEQGVDLRFVAVHAAR